MRQDASIEGIRFRQVPCRFGTIADLARVDDGQGELDHSQGCDQGTLPAPSRLAHDECGLQLAQACDPRGDAIVIVGNTPAGGPRTAGNSKVLLRDIKTTTTGVDVQSVRKVTISMLCKINRLQGLTAVIPIKSNAFWSLGSFPLFCYSERQATLRFCRKVAFSRVWAHRSLILETCLKIWKFSLRKDNDVEVLWRFPRSLDTMRANRRSTLPLIERIA